MMNTLTLDQICTACHGIYSGSKEKLQESVSGISIDSRNISPGFLFIATKGERVDGHNFITSCYENGALCCLGEEPPLDASRPYIQVTSSFQALKDIAETYRQTLQIPVIGITGSVGKTSTKEMIASVLEAKYHPLKTAGNFNNEVGLPLTVFRIEEEHDMAVLEMGISDFGEMHRLSKIARPNICVITNIGFCHLEFLGDRDGVLKAKSEIFDFAPKDTKVILNGDDDKLYTLKDRKDLDITYFGLDSKNQVYAEDIENLGLDGLKCKIITPQGSFEVHIPIPGIHMIYNALAGTCVGLSCGMTLSEIQQGIQNLQPISGRNHIIHTKDFTIMDDCYNANPVSMKASLDVLSSALGRKVAILGDMGELGPQEKVLHREVGIHAAQKQIDLLLCVGDLAAEYVRGALEVNPQENVLHFAQKEDLLGKLPKLLNPGDSILIKASHFMEFEKLVNYFINSNK